MTSKNLTAKPVTLPRRALTSAEFSQLEDVPPETEWFANIDNAHTRRAYRNDLKEFMISSDYALDSQPILMARRFMGH
jgi:hypothetical protein